MNQPNKSVPNYQTHIHTKHSCASPGAVNRWSGNGQSHINKKQSQYKIAVIVEPIKVRSKKEHGNPMLMDLQNTVAAR